MKWILSTISLSLAACSIAAPVTTSAPATITVVATATPNIAPSAPPIPTTNAVATTALATQAPQAPTAQVVATATAIKASLVEVSYKNIPAGVTSDGFYFLGNANAPVTLTDYSDFL